MSRASVSRRPAAAHLLALCLALVAAVGAAAAPSLAAPAPATPTTVADAAAAVLVEYFHEQGCPICERIDREVLPTLQHSFGGLFSLRQLDTAERENYLALVRHQERLGNDVNASAIIVVDEAYIFAGWEAISTQFPVKLEELVLLRLEAGMGQDAPAVTENAATDTTPGTEPETPEASDEELLASRLRNFTWLGVAVAGLIDGVNPCAISTLVFFLSMLAVCKIAGTRMIGVGIAFCAASFLTYTAIGFGLLRALHLLSGFGLVRDAIEWGMIAVLAVLAVLSFRDALRYKRSGKSGDVTLQLPHSIKLQIHRVIREGMGGHRLFVGSFVTGCLVTALESVCTGQVYVPTLVIIVKQGDSKVLALGYLLTYNALFICPLVAAFVVTYRGLTTKRLLQWSQGHVVSAKFALAALFAAMAVLLLVL